MEKGLEYHVAAAEKNSLFLAGWLVSSAPSQITAIQSFRFSLLPSLSLPLAIGFSVPKNLCFSLFRGSRYRWIA